MEVIGISRTLVEALVEKAKSAIQEEAEQWQTLEREIVFIKDEFEMMKSFLNTADGERMKNQVARTWVGQVRDLSYDTEDSIELVLHLDSKRSWWLRLQPSWNARMLPLDQAVAEMKLLKARAEDVNQRNLRYNLIGNSGEQMVQNCAASQRTSDIFIKPRDAFDMQDSILPLTKMINTKDEGLQVISVCGTGGDLGNISIIKKAYDDQEIHGNYKCRAWVKLVHPFNIREFIGSLLVEYNTNSPREQGAGKVLARTEATQGAGSVPARTEATRGVGGVPARMEATPGAGGGVPVRTEATQGAGGVPAGSTQGADGVPASTEATQGVGSLPARTEATQGAGNVLARTEATQGTGNVLARMEATHGADNVRARAEATQDLTVEDVKKSVKDMAYLIVLEDVSSHVQLNAIKRFMPDKNRGRIVVSTQQLEIASLCTGQPYHVSLLRKFSADHSVYAFFNEQVRRSITMLQLQGTAPHALSQKDSRLLIARDSEAKKLKEQINLALSGEAHHVVSVCGIAGVGKSFLVKTLFNDSESPAWNFVNGWVSAPFPFDILDLCKNIYQFTPEGSIYHFPPSEDEDIVLAWWDLLESRQWLLVIDDLQTKEDWDLIKANLISRASKSCVIVITREESVARHCATLDDAVCCVKGLEADVALPLFEKVIKDAGTSNPDPKMMEEAGFIINKCGRLPKLIVALGNYYANGPNIIQEMRRLNANFMYELKTSKGLDSFRDVFTTMHSSFQACPQLLKKCIFYLSLFTQSSIIRRSRLVRRWIAEGYCEGLDSNSKVEYTEKLLGNLATLGMIDKPPQASTVAGGMRVTSCQVNSLFLDYIISLETEENMFLPLEITVLQGEGILNTQRAGQHIAIGSSWKRDKFVLDSLDFSRLRSLTVSRDWRPFFTSHRMRVLRVLDLEDTNVKDDDVRQILEQLPRLKFLSLRRCTKVYYLPDSLGNLKQLQTLDIRHTYVAKLPGSISKLQMLQYIRAGTSVALMDEEPSTTRIRYGYVDACDGVKVPKRNTFGALISLHTLGVINVSTIGGKDIQQVFKNLTQLRKLGVSGINRRNIKGFFSAIVGHGHLESLSLQLHMDKDLEWLGKITPPKNLQRIKMKVHVEKFKHWSCLRVLGQIRRLQTLCLHFKTEQDVELQFCDRLDGATWSTPRQFCELKVLEVACSSNLHVKFAESEMKGLELLKVRSLDGSSLNFSGLEHTTALKHVSLKGSFDDTLKQELQQKVNQHPNKPTWKLVEPRSS